jgi:PAS domain S-box-containing protein
MANGNGARAKRQLARGGSAVLEAERERVENAFQAEKSKLQSVVDALEYNITIHDTDFNIVYQNRQAKKPFGDRVGEKCYRVYEDRDTVCEGCPAAKVFKDGKSHTAERELVLSVGSSIYWENTASPIKDAKGRIVACVEIAKNITDRKRAQEALQEEKNKLQSVVGAMEDWLTVQDRDYNILYQNQPLIENYGDCLGEKCYRVYEGRDSICDNCPVQKAFNDGKSHTSERKVILPSGGVVFGEVKASPVRDANGRIVSCLEIVRNINERKRAEAELRESEERFRSIVDNSQVGVLILDDAHHILYLNDEQCRISGHSPDEVIGQDFRKFIDKGSQRLVAGRYVRRQRGEEVTPRYEFNFVAKNGQTRRVEVNATAIKDSTGAARTVVQILDVTERKQTEEALKEEKNKLLSVISAMEDSLTIQDREFNIIYQNEAARRASGGNRIGKKCYRAYENRDDVCEGCPVQKAFNDGKSHTAERRNVLPSGEVVFWENTANPIRDAKGKIISCLELASDITERKKAEEALADELTRRRILVDQSRDGIVVLDIYGKVYEANRRFAEMLGYTPEEVRELSVWDWEYQFPREQVAEMIRTVDETGDHFETRHRRKDGSTFDVEISTNGAVCAGQKLIFCVCRDVTERKQSERALVEAEEKYKKLVEANSDLIWEVDTEGWYTFVSPKIKDLLGYEVDEVVGKKRTLDFAPKKEAGKWLKRFRKINAKRTPFSGFEILHHHKNGNPVIFEVSGIPLFDGAGNFKGYVGVNKDITERKQVTEALRENQEFSTGLLENTPNPEFVLNPDTSIRYVNPAFEKLTGYKLAEIAGMKAPYPWWPKKESKAMTLTLKKSMLSGGKRSERLFRKKNGEPFWVIINSAPVIHRNKVLYFLINWIDITDRKRAEEEKAELEQKAHLASRLASVGEMASGIAHEINNPLTAVIGFAQLLMDNDLPEEIKEDLTIIHKEAQRAAGVARNLLTFARKHAPSKQLTNINGIIDGVLTLRAYEQNVSNIQISTKLAPNLPEVMADYSQLQQVFINIILNAEAAMLEARNGGTLTIITKKFNHSIRASFADDGPGISKENLNRIFDPFFTTKEVGKGTGLGLSVCHGIIAEHGGRIYARSKPGKGATFIVELPVDPQEQVEELNGAD